VELRAKHLVPVTLELFKASLQALIETTGHAQFEEHEFIAEGDDVMVRWTVRGVHRAPMWGAPPTGKPFAIEGINIFTVRDGKIVARRSFVDPAALVALNEPA
jgi:ketosteroid isomerase-like protein